MRATADGGTDNTAWGQDRTGGGDKVNAGVGELKGEKES